jgi:hypothetical protein
MQNIKKYMLQKISTKACPWQRRPMVVGSGGGAPTNKHRRQLSQNVGGGAARLAHSSSVSARTMSLDNNFVVAIFNGYSHIVFIQLCIKESFALLIAIFR